jgi:hypothetical protein
MRYRFEYTDGTTIIMEFETDAAAWSYAAMEGDHLLEVIPLED